MKSEHKNDEVLKDNNTRALYYKIADNLPALVKELEISAERGSKLAKKELKFYKAMLKELDKSELGVYM